MVWHRLQRDDRTAKVLAGFAHQLFNPLFESIDDNAPAPSRTPDKVIIDHRYARIVVSVILFHRHSICYALRMIKTFQFRIKDKNTAKHLDKLSRAVNFVWNFCGDTQRHALKWGKRWPNNYAFHALSSGCSKELGLHSQTIQAVCDEYATRRKQHKKRLLRFRGKKSLGWIPFKGKAIKVQGDGFRYQGQCYRVWLSRKLDGTIKAGSFSQDARGRWYVNLQCEVTAPVPVTSGKAVGIDLGLRTLATMHDGVKSRKIARERFYKDLEPALADAQRRRDKKRVQRIHAKIANRRKDYLHKVSTEIANEYQYIFIGDVSSSKLVKTKMAKSVLDTG